MKDIKLDEYEQSIEDAIETFVPITGKKREAIDASIAAAKKPRVSTFGFQNKTLRM